MIAKQIALLLLVTATISNVCVDSASILVNRRFIRATKGDGTDVKSLHVESRIRSRFATTHVTSEVHNVNAEEAKEVTFTAQLPSDAFISNFTMLIDGKLQVAEVKGKEEAKREFEAAKSQGKTTGLVAQKPRETDIFQTSVNVKAGAKIKFDLTYQEILNRVHGFYKHTVNIIDSKEVEDVKIDVFITEKGEIPRVHVPAFAAKIGQITNKELLQRPQNRDAKIKRSQTEDGNTNIHVHYDPRPGAPGQLAVLYDVTRQNSGGEIEVVDGFFVHFFAPPADFIDDMSANIVFVLDKSGSMSGTKFAQLKTAMETILTQLKEEDQFSVVWFSTDSQAWNSNLVAANEDNKDAALAFINGGQASGGTNIHSALLDGIKILENSKKSVNETTATAAVDMIMFLTDGLPSSGEITDLEEIRKVIGIRNKKSKVRIHCLAFGDDADFKGMRGVADDSKGLARKIYEASDAALQLDGFYNEIALPIFTNLKFKYLDDAVKVDTMVKSRKDSTFYKGGEMVVVGKLKKTGTSVLKGEIKADSPLGPMSFICGTPCIMCCAERRPCADFCRPICRPRPPFRDDTIIDVKPRDLPADSLGGFVERMWAYLTIKKNLEEAGLEVDSSKVKKLKRNAKKLALEYNFVTEQTSLIIVDKEPSIKSSADFDSEKPKPRFGSSSRSHRRGFVSGFPAPQGFVSGFAPQGQPAYMRRPAPSSSMSKRVGSSYSGGRLSFPGRSSFDLSSGPIVPPPILAIMPSTSTTTTSSTTTSTPPSTATTPPACGKSWTGLLIYVPKESVWTRKVVAEIQAAKQKNSTALPVELVIDNLDYFSTKVQDAVSDGRQILLLMSKDAIKNLDSDLADSIKALFLVNYENEAGVLFEGENNPGYSTLAAATIRAGLTSNDILLC